MGEGEHSLLMQLRKPGSGVSLGALASAFHDYRQNILETSTSEGNNLWKHSGSVSSQ